MRLLFMIKIGNPLKVVLLLLFLLCTASESAWSQTTKKIRREIKTLLKNEVEVEMDKIPVCLIGILAGDSTYVLPYGSEADKGNIIADEQTIFEIGGLSKVFTAALVERLVEEGVLHLDSSLNHYLPAQYHNPGAAPSLQQLLVHSSALPILPTEFAQYEKEANNPYAHISKMQLLQFYKNFDFQSEAQNKYHYSHINYALLEIAIEQAMQRAYPLLLKEKILAPLGLDRSFAANVDSLPILQGYTAGGQAVAPWSFRSFRASEGMKSSLGDLLRFARQNMAPEESTLSPLLLQLQEAAVLTDYNKNIYGAKGWHLLRKKKYYDVVVHTGHTSGGRAFMGFVKETRTAVVILSNTEYSTGSLGYLILRMLNRFWKKGGKNKS